VDWQQTAATLLQILGLVGLTCGFGLLAVWLGVVVGGVCLLVTGVALGLPADWAAQRTALRATRAVKRQ
jgi:hypothetical protein